MDYLGNIFSRGESGSHRVCPWWVGYLLASPLRRTFQDPGEILRPFIREGMNVLDIGCGMGFFSLPIARMVGEKGKVVCVDLQEKMIKNLMKRAGKAGLGLRIDTRVCRQGSLQLDDLEGKMDFAVAFAVVHEVPDKERFFTEIGNALKQTGEFLVAEPRGHVRRKEFEKTVSDALKTGLEVINTPVIGRSHAVLFGRHEKSPG